MSTTYYLIHNLCPICKRSNAIRLGKSSAGWKFALQLNGEKYYTNWKEMKKWLKQETVDNHLHRGSVIKNEYGKVISCKEFIKIVEGKQKLRHDKEFALLIDGFEFFNSNFS